MPNRLADLMLTTNIAAFVDFVHGFVWRVILSYEKSEYGFGVSE